MMLGVVVGSVWSTKKAPTLTGQPLLLVSPQSRSGPPVVAVDCVGAGEGETVLVTSGGCPGGGGTGDSHGCRHCGNY